MNRRRKSWKIAKATIIREQGQRTEIKLETPTQTPAPSAIRNRKQSKRSKLR